MVNDRILSWYTGKARDAVRDVALPLLEQSLAAQRWLPGASRKVRSLLMKQAVAAKFARAPARRPDDRGLDCGGLLGDVSDRRVQWWEAKVRGGDVVREMMYGAFGRAPQVADLCARLRPFTRGAEERAALATAERWAADFTPVAEAVAYLDSLRPAPVYVLGGTLSATVVQTLVDRGLDPSTVRFPPMRHELVEVEDPPGSGKVKRRFVTYIDWPEGTVHDATRFAAPRRSAARHPQCHACGHAIKDPGNWVPMLADGADGPHSLWVGRDCARNLFGADLSGDVEYANGAVGR